MASHSRPGPRPKVFISYSWSTPEHEAWVLDLATRLVESGVDVVLDKWELREGQDKFSFMERMVTDANVTKVLVISDKIYSEKADARRGGVGTESQIISREVYERADQRKFVPVVVEVDEHGAPSLPTFMKGRIYIDMSTPATAYQNFEQLVRWIYDKPLHVRPSLGRPPTYVTTTEAVRLGTTASFRVAISAIKEGKTTAEGYIRDYLSLFAENLENFRIVADPSLEPDDQVLSSIEHFIPHRDELIEFITVAARFRSEDELAHVIPDFLEQILNLKFHTAATSSVSELMFDNFRFILTEIMLYTVAVLISSRRFSVVKAILDRGYYLKAAVLLNHDARMRNFVVFWDYIRSLEEVRKRRLSLDRLTVVGDLLKARATRKDINFQDLMQADLILHVRSILDPADNGWVKWIPSTLVYAHDRSPFELFLRAESKATFELLRPLLKVDSKEDLIARFKQNSGDIQYGSPFNWYCFSPLDLMNIRKLATRD